MILNLKSNWVMFLNKKIEFHKAVGKKITLSVDPSLKFNAGGKQALINGISGNNKRYGDKEWLGFDGKDVEITIDLEKETVINSISMRFYNGNGQWIYAPKEIGFSFKLEDGKTINYLNQIKNSDSLLVNHKIDFKELKANSVVITIPNYGIIPDGKQGAGHRAWLFIDEIIVE